MIVSGCTRTIVLQLSVIHIFIIIICFKKYRFRLFLVDFYSLKLWRKDDFFRIYSQWCCSISQKRRIILVQIPKSILQRRFYVIITFKQSTCSYWHIGIVFVSLKLFIITFLGSLLIEVMKKELIDFIKSLVVCFDIHNKVLLVLGHFFNKRHGIDYH